MSIFNLSNNILFKNTLGTNVMSNDFVDYENLPLDQVLSFRINRLNSALMRQASLILAKESQLNLVEWRLLRLLAHVPVSIARDLNRVSGMNPALISRGIRRLELRELISTQRDEHDRRTQRLKLTPEGHKLYQQTLPIMGRRHEAHCACMNKEELEWFNGIMDKLEAQANIQDFPATENQED